MQVKAIAVILVAWFIALGARDHVDVEAFMHVVTAKHARPKPHLHVVT